MKYSRSDRVANEIKHIIGKALLTSVNDPKLQYVTITSVQVTRDLRYAKIFYSILSVDDRDQIEQALLTSKNFLRSEISRNMRLRYTPEIILTYDDTGEYAANISAILNKINDEKNETPDS